MPLLTCELKTVTLLVAALCSLHAAAGIVEWSNTYNYGGPSFTNASQDEQLMGPVIASRNGLQQPSGAALVYGWTLRNFLNRAVDGTVTNDFALALVSNRFISFTVQPTDTWAFTVSTIGITTWHRENAYLTSNTEYGIGLYTDAHGDTFTNLLASVMWVPPMTNWYTNLVLTLPDLGALTTATTFRLATIQASNANAYFVYGLKNSPEGPLALDVTGSIVPEPVLLAAAGACLAALIAAGRAS